MNCKNPCGGGGANSKFLILWSGLSKYILFDVLKPNFSLFLQKVPTDSQGGGGGEANLKT